MVSIPSKREGTCEHTLEAVADIRAEYVSIPSKREGTCELHYSRTMVATLMSFHSLQTGRYV